MPAILTHDFFGRDAYDDVSPSRGFVTQQQRQAFLLGNQGPDPLFYLVADPLVGRENRVGGLMHHAKPARLLSALRDALTMLTRDERVRGGLPVPLPAGPVHAPAGVRIPVRAVRCGRERP